MAEQLANLAVGVLESALDTDDLSLTLTSAAHADGFPSTGDFYVTIAPAGANLATLRDSGEIVRVSARSGTVFTLSARGQGGTTPATHAAGSDVFLSLTEEALGALIDEKVAAAGSGFETVAAKAADESLSDSTTLQDDNDLVFPIGSSPTEIWFFEMFLVVGASNSTVDFKCAFAGPSGATAKIARGHVATSGGNGFISSASSQPTATLNALTDVVDFATTGAGDVGVHLAGWVFGGGTAGNITLRWAQNTSDPGVVVVRKGSFVRAMKVVL